jgi:SAM-dependent methyltransferase
MSNQLAGTDYDEVPYANDPYPSSHPWHLAVVGIMAGLRPAPVERCRVLELGCARGGNLIPMAAALPNAQFVGIDSSARQIAAGREVIDAMGLHNVTLLPRDILELDQELGTFDFIVCHGTFSWVPRLVQDKILEVSARNLAPDGLVYISFNTNPGWRLRGVARELMCFHSQRFARPEDRVNEARKVLDFMASGAMPLDRNYGSVLREECEYIRDRPDSYVLHDHLEKVNDPIYFSEFMERAAAQKLQFVSEVQGNLLPLETFPPAVAEGVRRLAANELELEQFLDFLINRKFRQSVLCHAEAALLKAPRVEELAKLYVAAPQSAYRFPASPRNEPLLRAAIDHLASEWPVALPCESLAATTRGRINPNASITSDQAARDRDDLATDLLSCYKWKLVELQTHPSPFVVQPSAKPLASELARYQAGVGNTVTNLRHEAGQLNDFSRVVLRYLDGRHDRTALLAVLDRSRDSGRLDGNSRNAEPAARMPPSDVNERLEIQFGSKLDATLTKLARFSLLIA